jgi:hypothetical protein
MHLFAWATQLEMQASRFGSTLKCCARHSAMQDRRFDSHPGCAALSVDSAATKASMAEVKSRSRGAERSISYGRV